jgi:serine protease Do
MAVRLLRSIAALGVLALAFTSPLRADEPAESVFKKPAPQSVDELRAIEEAARRIAEKVLPCTVGLQVGGAQGSGVVISEDGYVLTAAHVVGSPGRDVRVRFPDGKTLRGKTLGMYLSADGGLVKITEEVKLPFLTVVPKEEGPKAGDWCVATGHPGGFQQERSPPVRVGRVIDVESNVIRTDCPLIGGDSGGPLFDMQGRIIGIHSRISNDVTFNLHAPALACMEQWENLDAGKIYPARPASRFLDKLDFDRDGKLTRDEVPEGPFRRVYDRLAEQLKLDAEKPQKIEEVMKTLGWSASQSFEFGGSYTPNTRREQSLRPQYFVRGDAVRETFDKLAANINPSLVQVECGTQRVALGTVVGADGWIITKASQLKDNPHCKLADGRDLPAQVAGVDKSWDIALLKVEAENLQAVRWPESSKAPIGAWIASPSLKGVASLGVVSVGERKITAVPGILGVQMADSQEEAKIDVVSPGSGAAEAGIQPGDIITHIDGKPVKNVLEVRAALKNFRVGDDVKVNIRRGENEMEMEVTLGSASDTSFGGSQGGRGRLRGSLSVRRDDFARALQHDTVLDPAQCGGPVIDLDGNVVGLNIARADRVASYALPGDLIPGIVERLKAEAAKKAEAATASDEKKSEETKGDEKKGDESKAGQKDNQQASEKK